MITPVRLQEAKKPQIKPRAKEVSVKEPKDEDPLIKSYLAELKEVSEEDKKTSPAIEEVIVPVSETVSAMEQVAAETNEVDDKDNEKIESKTEVSAPENLDQNSATASVTAVPEIVPTPTVVIASAESREGADTVPTSL